MLIHMLVMLIVAGAVQYGLLEVVNQTIRERSHIQTKSDRQFFLKQLKKNMLFPNSLAESSLLSPQNDNLKACIIGGPVATCTENCCSHNVAYGFSYLDPKDSSATIESKRRLTGPPGSPVYYTAKGHFCPEQTASSCDFKLTTTFTPHCPGEEASCSHAEHIKISINLEATNNFYKLVKDDVLTGYYFVNRNYKPSIIPMSSVLLKQGDETTITVRGNSGHPSETQSYIFSLCQSSNPGIAEIIQCYPFSHGEALVRVLGKALGTTNVQFRINDGGTANALSDIYSLTVEVIP